MLAWALGMTIMWVVTILIASHAINKLQRENNELADYAIHQENKAKSVRSEILQAVRILK